MSNVRTGGRGNWTKYRVPVWVAFDPVTSGYIAIVPAVLFPVYFRRLLSDSDGAVLSWGLLAAAAIVASGLSGLGAAALSQRVPRLPLLVIFVSILVGATLVLSLDPGRALWIPGLAYLAAQCSYFAAMTVYESFLPAIARGKNLQRISGSGWAVGFSGGILAILVLIAVLADLPESDAVYRHSFMIVAAVTAAIAVPVFFALHKAGFGVLEIQKIRSQHASVWSTLREWRQHKFTFVLLASIILILSATAVVVNFTAPIITARFGTTYHQLLLLLLVLQVLSIPSTLLASALTARWSRQVPILVVLGGWAMILLLLAFGNAGWTSWIVVAVLGCCVGATNATLRGFLAESIPASHAGVFFGLLTFAGRLGSAAGPLLFAAVDNFAGQTIGLLAILALLLGGTSVLQFYLVQAPDR